MKNYLNKEEMISMVVVYNLAEMAERVIGGWKERGNLTEIEEEKLKAVVDGADEFLIEVLKRMRPDQEKRFNQHCNENAVYIRPRMTAWEYKLQVQKEMEEDGKAGTWIENETAAALADLMLFKNCNPCCLDACDREHCPIRKVFLQLGIPAYDEYAEGCPYDNGGVV